MAYTRAWNDNTPLGSTAADLIDNAFRILREDISERMDDLTAVGGKWSTDDPVLLPSTASAIQSARRYNYNDNVVVGNKVSDGGDVQTILALQVVGLMTNGAGQITLNLAALTEEDYDLDDINWAAPVRGILHDDTTNDFVFLLLVAANSVADTITYKVQKANGGLVTFHALTGILLFYQNSRPV